MSKYPKRGEVYWVTLDPVIGTETCKTRPAVIVSNDDGNEISKRIVACPITSNANHVYPFEVKIEMNGKTGKIMADQLKALDKQRLGKKMFFLGPEIMEQVDKALKLVLSLS